VDEHVWRQGNKGPSGREKLLRNTCLPFRNDGVHPTTELADGASVRCPYDGTSGLTHEIASVEIIRSKRRIAIVKGPSQLTSDNDALVYVSPDISTQSCSCVGLEKLASLLSRPFLPLAGRLVDR